jgi:titin
LHTQITYENEKSTLVITEAFPKDAGTYKVTAKNLAGETTNTCNVSVKGRLPHETSDSELASDMEPIKPSVQLPLKDVAIFEGKSVRLDCVIVGQPEPEVIWYHDNRPVKESADFQLLFQGDRCSLVILEAFLEDAGDYKVVAINSAGEASSSCKLSVTPLNLAEPATRVPVDRMLPTEVPPRFEKLLSDILADEGSKVEFECSLVGDPRPTIKWFLNNKEVQESDRVRSIYQEDGVVKLIIAMINPDDKGVYTIKATNPSGEAKCFSHLIVKSVNGSEPLSPQVELEEKFTCPAFKELFADRFVMPDEMTKFECIVVGKPTPKVKWFFNDEPVHGTGFLISTSGDRQVLTVQKVSAETVGKVTCIAENEVGKAACTAHIKLVDDVAKTTSQVMTQEDTSGSSLVTVRKQVTTSTTSQQLNTNINGVPQTQITTTTNNADSSFKQIGDQSPEVIETKQYQEYRQVGDLPPVLQQKSIVSFTKNNATEIHDSIIPNSGQITTGKPVRRNIAPRFITPLVGKIVDQGVDVLLEGIIDGYPAPEVKITKNDEEIVNVEGKIRTQYDLHKIIIEIKNADVHDAGRYSITATNLAGTSKSTADLVVKSK